MYPRPFEPRLSAYGKTYRRKRRSFYVNNRLTNDSMARFFNLRRNQTGSCESRVQFSLNFQVVACLKDPLSYITGFDQVWSRDRRWSLALLSVPPKTHVFTALSLYPVRNSNTLPRSKRLCSCGNSVASQPLLILLAARAEKTGLNAPLDSRKAKCHYA